ncbi:uncharacterized protein LOC111397048 [Olea europaea var. sylvestris]|uniref:uncharacterized protein LOC111397048 n=1 Tax=Olea europaea var. sylvestris TaxID=158386 RepID=UPI000C1CDB7E|nr:uncharacterized protein LOC111397048 [Olea europaea var. sylvestris]
MNPNPQIDYAPQSKEKMLEVKELHRAKHDETFQFMLPLMTGCNLKLMNNGPAASMPMTNQMHQFWRTALLMPTKILFTMLNIPAVAVLTVTLGMYFSLHMPPLGFIAFKVIWSFMITPWKLMINWALIFLGNLQILVQLYLRWVPRMMKKAPLVTFPL